MQAFFAIPFLLALALSVCVASEIVYGDYSEDKLNKNDRLVKRSAALLPDLLTGLTAKLPPEIPLESHQESLPKQAAQPKTKLQPLLPVEMPPDSPDLVRLQLPPKEQKTKSKKPLLKPLEENSSLPSSDKLPKDSSSKLPKKVVSTKKQLLPSEPSQKEMSKPPNKFLPVNPPKFPVKEMSLPPKPKVPQIKLPTLPEKVLPIPKQKPSAVNPPLLP